MPDELNGRVPLSRIATSLILPSTGLRRPRGLAEFVMTYGRHGQTRLLACDADVPLSTRLSPLPHLCLYGCATVLVSSVLPTDQGHC